MSFDNCPPNCALCLDESIIDSMMVEDNEEEEDEEKHD